MALYFTKGPSRNSTTFRFKQFYYETKQDVNSLAIIAIVVIIITSSVGIATGYGLDDRGVGVLVPLGS
jgi:hypothetical protein